MRNILLCSVSWVRCIDYRICDSNRSFVNVRNCILLSRQRHQVSWTVVHDTVKREPTERSPFLRTMHMNVLVYQWIRLVCLSGSHWLCCSRVRMGSAHTFRSTAAMHSKQHIRASRRPMILSAEHQHLLRSLKRMFSVNIRTDTLLEHSLRRVVSCLPSQWKVNVRYWWRCSTMLEWRTNSTVWIHS